MLVTEIEQGIFTIDMNDISTKQPWKWKRKPGSEGIVISLNDCLFQSEETEYKLIELRRAEIVRLKSRNKTEEYELVDYARKFNKTGDHGFHVWFIYLVKK